MSFLVYLLGLDVQGPGGRVLTQIMTPSYIAARRLRGLADVAAHVAALGEGDDAAAELAQRLAGWLEKPLARVMFDPGLPAADTRVDATVWRTHCFSQPNGDQLLHEHLFRQLPPEKILGRAYYRVLVGLGRRLCFADRSRVAALGLDEMYDAMSNPENVEDLEAFVRRGRRPKALIVAGGHDAGDGGSDVLTGLIPTRVVMRHRDKTLATRALQLRSVRIGRMLRNRKRANVFLSSIAQSIELLQSSIEAIANETTKPESWWARWSRWLGPVIAVVTVMSAVATVFLLNSELQAVSRQTASSEAALRADLRSRDYAFLSSVRSSINQRGITITNLSRTPVGPLAYWLMQSQGDSRVIEITGAVQGLGTCTTMSIEWSHLSKVQEKSAEESAAPQAAQMIRLPYGDSSELHLAIQAPSGKWFLLGASGTLSAIELPSGRKLSEDAAPQERMPTTDEPTISTYLYDGSDMGLKVLEASEIYRTADDTYREGFSSVDVYTVWDDIISSGNAISGISVPGVRIINTSCSD